MTPGPNTAGSLTAVANWVMGHDAYRQSAKEEFLRVADHQRVALAHEHEWSVVTLEVAGPACKSTVKAPAVCQALGVPCLTRFDALLAERPVLVLARGNGGFPTR